MGSLRAGPATAAYVAVVTLLGAAPEVLPAGATAGAARAAALVLTLPAGALMLVVAPAVVRTGPGGAALHVAGILLPAVCALGNALLVRVTRRVLRGRRAENGVERRLAYALRLLALPVTPMARSRGRARAGAGRLRHEHSLLLRDVPLPYRELVGHCRGLWTGDGLRVQERAEPPALRAQDSDGYEFLLEAAPGPFGDAVLQVASPSRPDLGLLTGLAAGGLPIVLFLTLRSVDLPPSLGPALTVGPGLASGPHLATGIVLTTGLALTGLAALITGLAALRRPATRYAGAGLLTTAVCSAFMIV